MTAEIVWEGSTLCRTLWWGMVFAAEYDTIRIFRRIVKHKTLLVPTLEDIIYWMYISVKIFSICFYVNDGIIRAFIIAGFIMGAGVYVKALSRYYIKYGVRLIKCIIKIITIIIIKPLKLLLSVIKMVTGKLLFPLKWCCIHIRVCITSWINKGSLKRSKARGCADDNIDKSNFR